MNIPFFMFLIFINQQSIEYLYNKKMGWIYIIYESDCELKSLSIDSTSTRFIKYVINN